MKAIKLVIVESPTKAKTIGRFLGDGFVIKASFGHIMDLPKSKLGVDTEHDFVPDYQMSPDKKKTVAELKKLAKDADSIILATDPDREGEAISAHIEQVLRAESKGQRAKNSKHSALSSKPFQRIVFHEITKEAIQEALEHPGLVNKNLVDAQTARRVLDRLVGYKLSPILWTKVRRGLSAGRVQSVALRLIVEREREIEKFVKENYWTISVILKKDVVVPFMAQESAMNRATTLNKDEGVEFELIEIDGQKIELQSTFKLYDGDYKVGKTIITSEERAEEIKLDLEKGKYVVADVLKKQTKRSPQPPFTTSTLQQEASRRFGFSGKRTMSLAQKLYEEGYITYHRTDSVNLAAAAVTQMRNYVENTYGSKYIPEQPRIYVTKQKLAQEAHEAIRPTNVSKIQDLRFKIQELGSGYWKLYELIWIRAVASQMSDALVESTAVLVDVESSKKYRFKTNGSVLVFDGFLKINPFGLQDKKIPDFKALESLNAQNILTEKHETSAPPRYNDASLIKSLEEGGVGRPSTYATIIGTIETRNYIIRDQGRFTPTSIGMAVNDFLVKNFSNIDDIPFTASTGDQLDAIAQGEKQWVPVIKDFYTPFEKQLKEVAKAERVQIAVEQTGEMCPKDGAPLVIREGKFGKFISCSNFPTCDFKKPYIIETNFLCPKDGGLPAGRQGRIVEKKTKKGKTFYGCSNYPACTYAAWKLEGVKKDIAASSGGQAQL